MTPKTIKRKKIHGEFRWLTVDDDGQVAVWTRKPKDLTFGMWKWIGCQPSDNMAYIGWRKTSGRRNTYRNWRTSLRRILP